MSKVASFVAFDKYTIIEHGSQELFYNISVNYLPTGAKNRS
jgi:hypothetical protein